MGQLYRWVEKKTGRIVYVGMVAGNTLADIYRRTKSEKSQLMWAKEPGFQIQYLAGKLLGKPDFSLNETKALETHFINLYQTGKNGYNKNYQISGGTMSFIPDEYEMAWIDLPDLAEWNSEGHGDLPWDELNLGRIQEFFISNGKKLLELEEIYFCVLYDYVYGYIQKETIKVYCNKHLGLLDGITYNKKRFQFFDRTALSNDNSVIRCIDGNPVEPVVFHWTGYLRSDTITNLIQFKPCLDEIRDKVMKAKTILEEYNPALISNPKANRFHEIYEDLKASKHETIEECFQKALKKTRKRMRQNKHPEI